MIFQQAASPLPAASVLEADLPWNVLATAKDKEQRHLARRLRRFGDFRWTQFRGVLVGRVEDQQAFFEQLRRCEEHEPGFLQPLARMVPIDQFFTFTVDDLTMKLKQAMVKYAGLIGSGTFYVRVERRGYAGAIHSRELEQELDRTLVESLKAGGEYPVVSFHDPDVILAVETIGNECGIGALTRALRSRFPFIRVS